MDPMAMRSPHPEFDNRLTRDERDRDRDHDRGRDRDRERDRDRDRDRERDRDRVPAERLFVCALLSSGVCPLTAHARLRLLRSDRDRRERSDRNEKDDELESKLPKHHFRKDSKHSSRSVSPAVTRHKESTRASDRGRPRERDFPSDYPRRSDSHERMYPSLCAPFFGSLILSGLHADVESRYLRDAPRSGTDSTRYDRVRFNDNLS